MKKNLLLLLLMFILTLGLVACSEEETYIAGGDDDNTESDDEDADYMTKYDAMIPFMLAFPSYVVSGLDDAPEETTTRSQNRMRKFLQTMVKDKDAYLPLPGFTTDNVSKFNGDMATSISDALNNAGYGYVDFNISEEEFLEGDVMNWLTSGGSDVNTMIENFNQAVVNTFGSDAALSCSEETTAATYPNMCSGD